MPKMKKEELRKVKDQAARALKKGSWEKALEKHEILIQAQPKDLRLRMKKGDILVKLKKMDEAVKTYEDVADEYAADGFLIQAISVLKIIQQNDPKRPGIKEKLEELNLARGRSAAPAAKAPVAAPPDAEPGLPSDKSLKEEMEEAKQRQEEQDAPPSFPETPLFGQLGHEEFMKVVSKFQVGTIPRATQVIKEGTKGDALFIVSSGDIRVYRTHPKTGKKITLAHLKDGAFFGEMAILLDSERKASCETAVETMLLRINRADLDELMAEYPNIKAVMYDFFKQRALDQLFKTMPLFSSLDDAERDVLKDKFGILEAEAGETIIREGEEGKFLWLIFSGEVEVTTQHEDKGTVKLATIGYGDYVGEIALVQGKLNTADVTASEKSILFRLPRDIFKELLQIHSPMLEELTSTIEQRLRSTVEMLLKA